MAVSVRIFNRVQHVNGQKYLPKLMPVAVGRTKSRIVGLTSTVILKLSSNFSSYRWQYHFYSPTRQHVLSPCVAKGMTCSSWQNKPSWRQGTCVFF